MNERDRAVMGSYLANSQDATFRGFDASVQKEKFAGPLRSLFSCVYRMGFESGWHAHADAVRPPVEGMVHMVAYGDKRDVMGMFDTPEQAHAFVAWLKPFMRPAGDAMPEVDAGAQPTAEPACECGAKLLPVKYESGYLNEDQFMADRRGDWYCAACKPMRYYWNREVQSNETYVGDKPYA